jgi:hypothetical protein
MSLSVKVFPLVEGWLMQTARGPDKLFLFSGTSTPRGHRAAFRE